LARTLISEARRALRQALHAIRPVADDGILESRPDDSTAITEDGSWCDAVAFERALDGGRMEDGLGLYHGFLGTSGVDSSLLRE
jgi:DNA-binding SARP family transcriptional activator